jgi:hypothetical protein
MLPLGYAHAVRDAGVFQFVNPALNRREIDSYFPGTGWINTSKYELHITNNFWNLSSYLTK